MAMTFVSQVLIPISFISDKIQLLDGCEYGLCVAQSVKKYTYNIIDGTQHIFLEKTIFFAIRKP